MPTSLHDAINQRQTVRRFSDTPLTSTQRDALIEAAALAPSPHGRQPWMFVEIGHGTPRHRLCEAMSSTWRTQLALDGSDADTINKRIAASTQRIVDAPLLIMPCVDMHVLDVYPDPQRQHAEYIMAVQSIGCAIEHMLLTAVALGFAGGWMCAPLFCADIVRDVFALPAHVIPQALIPFGYLAQAPQRRPKRNASEFLYVIPADNHST